ncbi:putative EF-hand domain-containing protein [Helianthus annuus]|nr:putative EF-hand domain-containing protein [Helianthus annuus]KAJ0702892.1 putative EF-hand domain-containing protein [Helianthus annuus]
MTSSCPYFVPMLIGLLYICICQIVLIIYIHTIIHTSNNIYLLYYKMSTLSYNDLYRLFKTLNQNGDGLISPHELQWLLDTMKVSSGIDELECLTEKSSLSFPEFLEFYDTITKQEKEGENESENDLFKAFEMFDKNRDGFISDEELEEALSRLGLWDETGHMDVKSMIKAYDDNCDGFLDFQEFKKMMA